MEDKELSQWFYINEQKPWEHGVYEVSSSTAWNPRTYSSYWCGEKFHGGWGNPNGAYENKDHPGDGCGAEWRGLASNLSAKPKPKGNRKVTRYVVMLGSKPIATFSTKQECLDYCNRGKIWWTEIETIRFRTPEA